MNTCSLQNFRELSNIQKTELKSIPFNNIDDYVIKVVSVLREGSFSTDSTESLNPNNYEKSINKLIQQVLDIVNISDKETLQTKLREEFLPKEDKAFDPTEAEKDLDASDVLSLKLKTVLENIFEDNEVILEYRNSEFERSLLYNTIISSERIIDSDISLNRSLCDYKSEQYEILREFLRKFNIALPEFYFTGTAYTKNAGISKAYKLMYNYLESLKNKGYLRDMIQNSYISKMNGQDSLFLDALNAFINLQFFDDLVKQANFLSVNNKLDEPIEIENDVPKFKFSIERKNKNARRGLFAEEYQDAVKQMGSFSRCIIKSIPLIDLNGIHKDNKYLEPKDFNNAFVNLRTSIYQLNGIMYSEVKDLMADAKNHPNNIITILQRIKDDTSLRKALRDKKVLSDYDINVLISTLNQVFIKYKNIEDKYIQTKGTNVRYNTVNTILGLINSTASMNYLETYWDNSGEVPSYKTRTKARFSSNTSIWDYIKNINKTTVNRADKTKICDTYPSVTTILGTTVTFSTHILDVKAKIKNESGSLNLFSFQDEKGNIIYNLSTSEGKSKALFDQKFEEVLNFIDTMLGTKFYTNIDELSLLLEFQPNGFNDIFKAALRALQIIHLYNDFEGDNIESILEESGYKPQFWKTNNSSNFYFTEGSSKHLSTVKSSEDWINNLLRAKSILGGQSSRSVIKNFEQNNVPLTSPTFLGAELHHYLQESAKLNSSSSKLLFVKYPDAIIDHCEDTDIKMRDGETKSIKNMSEAELFQHAIIDKFFIPLLSSDNVYIQPTTFSDKTKFVNYITNLSQLGINIYSSTITNDCQTKMLETIGEFYKDIWKQVYSDYEKLFKEEFDNNNIEFNIVNIDKKLNSLKESEFIELCIKKGVVASKEVLYRITNNKLTVNELLYDYANNLYKDVKSLQSRLNIERREFVNDLIRSGQNFYITREKDGIKRDAIGDFLMTKFSDIKTYLDEWVIGNTLILGKYGDENILTEEIPEGVTVELNPLLEAYFSVDVLLSNNLRFSLTGSEINHPVKSKYNVVQYLTDKEISNDVINNLNIQDGDSLVTAIEKSKNNKLVNNLLRHGLLYNREAGGFGAQLKRNVIIPGTLRTYDQNLINGVSEDMEVAVIKDIKAFVHNFDKSGVKSDEDDIDAHDGFANIHPVMSILENYSLDDSEVGDMKKNILHDYDHRFGSATLFKYAAGAITNAKMADSLESPISLYNLFKKMSNKRWSKRNKDGSLTWLLKKGNESGKVILTECDYKATPFNFYTDILSVVSGGKLFYEYKNTYRQILDFGIKDGVYYTKEQKVNVFGVSDGSKPFIVNHYFDNVTGQHKSQAQLLDENGNEINHTIDTIAELHEVLGGINSLELDEVTGKLVQSENSLKALTQFVNKVSNKRFNVTSNNISQVEYDQPLKRAFIAYVINTSALKNGAGNINPTKAYYDEETPLHTITVKTKHHGIQLDSDHHADEAELTEFSQVINSLDANARIHDYVSQIYEALGQVAIKLSQVELDSVEEFKNSNNKSKLYTLLARVIINNIKKDQKSLLSAIVNEVTRELKVTSDQALSVFKIPFSDPNIYNEILSSFVSIINSKSIKRKFPGSGMIMMPAYDTITIYDYNGETYTFSDLVKVAKKELKNEVSLIIKESNNTSDFKRKLIQKLLEKEQNKQIRSKRTDIYYPDDRINIYLEPEDVGEPTFIRDIHPKSLKEYYDFIDNPQEFAKKITGIDGNFVFSRNVTKPRNLAASRIQWTINYKDSNNQDQQIVKNPFTCQAVRDAYYANSEDVKKIRAEVQKIFDNLEKGIYEENGISYTISNLINKPAECIVPNIYLSKYGFSSNQSIYDIQSSPLSFVKIPKLLNSNNYDLAFTSNNEDHTYITLNSVTTSDDLEIVTSNWTNIVIEDYDHPTIKQRVFAVDKNNVKLFEVARYIIDDNVLYDENTQTFIDKQTKEILDSSQYIRYGQTQNLRKITFVTKNKVTEKGVKRYSLYNINTELFNQVQIEGSTLGTIINDIYKSKDHTGIMMNGQMSTTSINSLSQNIDELITLQSHNPELNALLKSYKTIINNAVIKENTATIDIAQIKKANKIYAQDLSKAKRASFEKARYFTSARIPAQCHQSFMKMIAAAFLTGNVNHCYVSHYQTFLQGSK